MINEYDDVLFQNNKVSQRHRTRYYNGTPNRLKSPRLSEIVISAFAIIAVSADFSIIRGSRLVTEISSVALATENYPEDGSA